MARALLPCLAASALSVGANAIHAADEGPALGFLPANTDPRISPRQQIGDDWLASMASKRLDELGIKPLRADHNRFAAAPLPGASAALGDLPVRDLYLSCIARSPRTRSNEQPSAIPFGPLIPHPHR